MKKSKKVSNFISIKKRLFLILAVVFIIIIIVFIVKKYKIKKPLSVIENKVSQTKQLEKWGEKSDFLYILEKDTDDGKKIYEFFYDDKKYFTITGGLQSVFINKNNPTKDFYIHLDDKLIIYPDKISIDVGYHNNFHLGYGDSEHRGSVWIGKDKNIYKTSLYLEQDLDCNKTSLKLLKEKYKINWTNAECKREMKRGAFRRKNAVCIKYKKYNNIWKQEKAILTNTDACDTKGCGDLTFDDLDKSYIFLNNFVPYEYIDDKELQDKIEINLKKNKLILDGTVILLFKTKDLIIAQRFLDSLSVGKIFVLDDNLNLKTILDINLNNTDFKKHIHNFLVRKDKLFIFSSRREIFIYDLKTLKNIGYYDNIKYFTFL